MSQIQSFLESAGPGPGLVNSLTGDDMVAVSPDGAGNINILSSTGDGTPNDYNFASVVAQGGVGTNHTLLIEPVSITVTTNDAIPTSIYVLNIPSNRAVFVRATIIGQRSNFTACAGGDIVAIGRNPGGVGAVVTSGGSGIVSDYIGNPPPTAYGTSLGNLITIDVVGVAGQTWDWTANIMYQFENA